MHDTETVYYDVNVRHLTYLSEREMAPDRVAAKRAAEERHCREISERIRQILIRRGRSVEEVGRQLEALQPPVTGGDRRQLRRMLAGGQRPNVHVLTRLSQILDCSPGWLISGIGYPDVESYQIPDYSGLSIDGLEQLPEIVRRRLLHLSWAIALKQTDYGYDTALKVWRDVCSELVSWLHGPFSIRYFERPVTDIGWIDYALKALDGLESLNMRTVERRKPG